MLVRYTAILPSRNMQSRDIPSGMPAVRRMSLVRNVAGNSTGSQLLAWAPAVQQADHGESRDPR
ncbi:MAG: hypothetical protein M1350_07615 [Actinobacteria bacterium]|nr:hypothetical protein [Actinomycetota bacterium]